ncbi:MAG TPA: sigma-70 family RNA polymerase sigma factor [Polyangiaceae bacterium]|nr:sigma-70 family RNA polymerase sigma factor [Polyangiaceae bacterium]
MLTQEAQEPSLPLPSAPPPASERAAQPPEIGTSLPYYIARVQAIPPLSRENEYELACRIRDGADDEAARRLVEANLRYVVAIALSYRRYGVRLADLISEGNVGLMIALKKFDPSRGTRFVTYAAHWIRAYVLDHVIRAWSIVGVGAGPLRSKVFFRLRREKARILASTSDITEANERLAERFGTTTEKISMMANRLEARDVSLDAKVFDDGAATVLDTVPGGDPSQEEQFLFHERSTSVHACVREAVEKLDPRERFIVEVRMMADHADELSLAEIGRRLGVSRERARQLEARAKQKLRRHLETHGGEFSTAA